MRGFGIFPIKAGGFLQKKANKPLRKQEWWIIIENQEFEQRNETK